ncbi:MAG: hypothetical protein AB7I38_07780 [Dehalococcoidia bacterium]
MMEFADRPPDGTAARGRVASVAALPDAPRAVVAACRAGLLHAAARLLTPHCPRCGVGTPEAVAAPRPERDPIVTLRCRACAHHWDVLPPDPFLGV